MAVRGIDSGPGRSGGLLRWPWLTLLLGCRARAHVTFIEDRTGWSIKRFVRPARRYCTVQIRAGQHILTAEEPLSPDLQHPHVHQMSRRCALT